MEAEERGIAGRGPFQVSVWEAAVVAELLGVSELGVSKKEKALAAACEARLALR